MSRSPAIADSAVLTTAMSSMSIAVAAQTTASVQRWVRVMSGLRIRGRDERGERAARTVAERPGDGTITQLGDAPSEE